MEKIVRINMNKLSATYENVPEEYLFLGGRGLSAKIIGNEVPPNCFPLEAENKVIIAPGLLTGSSAPSSGRLSIGAKSPLTGTIKESNVGGTIGQSIAKLGIKAIIIEGKPETKDHYLIEIQEHGIDILPEKEDAGTANYEMSKKLNKRYGKKIPYLLTGPAGMSQLSIATVAASDLEGRPTRHAGRGGLGAVLGSKGVKAIIVNGKGKRLKAKDEKTFKQITKEFAKDLVHSKKALHNFGTAVLVNVINSAGALPVNNFRMGHLENVDTFSGEILAKNCNERGGKTGHACHAGCVIKCSNIYHSADSKYLTSALEYETIVLLGCNCGIQDIDQIAYLDYMCDNYGIDTMETGTTLAVAMEGNLLEFGDFDGMKNLIEQIIEGTIKGKLLGQGAYITGKTLGVKRIPTVKGQSISAYDPRALKGTGVTYATSPMGGDHTAGNCLPGRTGLDDLAPEGQVKASVEVQIISALCDNLGLCIFVGPVMEVIPTLTKLLNAFTGKTFSEEQILSDALSIIKQETKFNAKAGYTEYQNDLPSFFRKEKLHSDLVFDVPYEELQGAFNEKPSQ